MRREPVRARASTPEPGRRPEREAGSSDALAAAVKPAGIPTLVKVLGGALVILAGVYLLSRQRDQALTETKPSPIVVASSPAPLLEAAPEAPTASAPAPPKPVAPRPVDPKPSDSGH